MPQIPYVIQIPYSHFTQSYKQILKNKEKSKLINRLYPRRSMHFIYESINTIFA